MRYLLLLLAAASLSTSYAQKAKKPKAPKPPKGYKISETGIQYKFHKDLKGRTAKVGDIVVLHMELKTEKDSVLRSTFKEGAPIEAFVQEPPFKGSLEHGLIMLSEGDSATFLISADSLFQKSIQQEMPPFIRKGSMLRFTLAPRKVYTQEELMKEQKEQEGKQKGKDSVLIAEYISKNNLNATRTPSGLYYVVKEKGTGNKPVAGQTVVVHYAGKLLDGTEFDSSVKRGQPFEFGLGQGQVIRGWDEGIALMNVGEKGTLLIPSHLGYGPQGAGGAIPPNSVLIFDVELINIK